jgi:hypothetical protein
MAVVGRLGAQPVLQRALEEEVAYYLGRARNTTDRFVSQFLPAVQAAIRTRPLARLSSSLIIGAKVGGLGTATLESLIDEVFDTA